MLTTEALEAFYAGVEAVKNNSSAYQSATQNKISDAAGSADIDMMAQALLPDGIYVASRITNGNYKEIQTMFTLGSNIGAAYNTSVYFMHNFNDVTGNLNIDSGILFAGDVFAVYHSGTINNNGYEWHSGSSPIDISPGDTVYINSKIQNNCITTYVKNSYGAIKASLTTPYKECAKGITSAPVKREFNIAGNGNINNKDTYFSWSSGQSTVTNVNNYSYKMSSSNSYLQPITFTQPTWNHSHVGKGRSSYTADGYIYDRAWCRCNNN